MPVLLLLLTVEWDNVEVANDFLNLDKLKSKVDVEINGFQSAAQRAMTSSTWEFDFKSHGDDVNLVYVACTRAKKLVSLPTHVVGVLERFDDIHSSVLSLSQSPSSSTSQPANPHHGKRIPAREKEDDIPTDEVLELHRQLVMPLRREFGMSDRVSICSTLIENYTTTKAEDVACEPSSTGPKKRTKLRR